MMINPSINEQMDLIKEGVVDIIPEEQLQKIVENSIDRNTPLKIKLGCDPSRPDLHIGHSVVLKKLRHFQDLGHSAILLIGDFTAMIGDPTGKNKTRPQLKKEEIIENSQTYIEQSGKILDLKNLKTVYNSKWLNEISFQDLIKLSSMITVARMLERDDFTKRYKDGKPISMHEFLYPLAQGYDSVYLNSDVELGGTDQTFNLLVGRDLQREFKQEPQTIITTPLIEGTDGNEKMSKSYDNYIGFNDTPSDIYGKTMSIPDSLIYKYFLYTSNIDKVELESIKNALNDGTENPRDLKRLLARNLVSIYYSNSESLNAEKNFDRMFIDNQVPDDINQITLKDDVLLLNLLFENDLVNSKADGKRMIKQGAVRIDGDKVHDFNTIIRANSSLIIKVGKRRFLKIT